MAKLKLVGPNARKHVLVYGMRLLEDGDIDGVQHGEVVTTDGRTVGVTLHIIEGTVPQIKRQLAASIDAFFDLQDELPRD